MVKLSYMRAKSCDYVSLYPFPLRYSYDGERGKVVINFAFFPPKITIEGEITPKEKVEIYDNILQILSYYDAKGIDYPPKLKKIVKLLKKLAKEV